MKYRFLRFPNGKPKAVTFSYDDAVPQDLRLAEIMERYGIKGTFNVNSAWLDQKGHLSTQEIKDKILDMGHEVAVHGHLHRAPGIVNAIDAIQDVLECRLQLEQMFGRIIRGMAYPDSGITRFHNGTNYENIRRYLQDLGIVYSRTLAGDNNGFMLPTDWYAWMPTAHHKNPKSIDYAQEFAQIDIDGCYSSSRYPRLFYLWGHSYEFDNDQNWDRIETLCEILGDKQDTWYANNIEIYAYVTAYNSLVRSADGKTIYNPTLLTIWFDVDGKPYQIEPGQTLRLD